MIQSDTRHGADTAEDDGEVVTRVVEAEDDRSEIFSALDCGLDKKKNGNLLIRLIITFFINI